MRCCYCGAPARGRYAFLNRQEEVVDNMFCGEHSTQVYWQTKKTLEVMHSSSSVSRLYMIINRWGTGEQAPPLPKNKQELLAKGAIYIH